MIFPIVSEAVRGESVTVGPPYFNFFLRVFGLPLLLLMGIGPLVAWRRASIALAQAQLGLAGARRARHRRVLLLFGAGSSLPGLVTYTFSAFVLASIVDRVREGHAGASRAQRRQLVGRILGLVARNRRRYGGYVVHAAIVLLAIGVAGSSLYQTTREAKLSPGQSMEAAGYTLTYRELTQRSAVEPHRRARSRRRLPRRGAGRALQPGQEPLRRRGAGVERDGDLHELAARGGRRSSSPTRSNADGSVYFKVLVKPLVNLIWLAGFVFVARRS